jgi:hypothetical protein
VGDTHLKELRTALEQKGWRVISQEEGDGYRISGAWCIQRSTRIEPTQVLFEGSDDMAVLPVERAYACAVKDHKEIGLYFGSMKQFRKALPEFIRALDELEGTEVGSVTSQ